MSFEVYVSFTTERGNWGILSSLQINTATNIADLNSVMNECYNYLEFIGCLRLITSLSDKYLLAKDILAYHVIKRVQAPFER